ncbi:MAG: cobalt ECF transporter T component CbiQ [Bacteroidaceae bacterium]|nr:cobalt ECF transporter T component CbiQ [Bacteroidaceae bacterium]
MNKVDRAMMELHAINYEAGVDGWMQAIHPLSKLLVTLVYLAILLSFDKYALLGVSLLGVCLAVLFWLGDVSLGLMGRRLWPLLLLTSLLGVANLFYDRLPLWEIGAFTVTGGMVSMLTLMLKGVFSLSVAYLLVVTTTIDDICHALRMIHIPTVLVTVLMLVYRYLMVLLKEVSRLSDAYSMRAPGHKGVDFHVWGSMVGQLLLRSIDRAEVVYGSMQLRGFQGDFKWREGQVARLSDYLYALAWIVLFLIIRCL